MNIGPTFELDSEVFSIIICCSGGQNKVAPQANYPWNMVRAHEMLRPRAQNGPWKWWLISIPDV